MKFNVEQITSYFDLGKYRSIRELLGGYANKNYCLTTETGSFFLRLCTQQPPELLNYELKLMAILKKHDFRTAYPIRSVKGDFIFSENKNTFMLYEYVTGRKPLLNQKSASEIGRTVGQLSTITGHKELKCKKNTLAPLHRETLITHFPKAGNPIKDIFEFVEKQHKKFSPLYADNLPKGIIHGDTFPNNTIFNDDNSLEAIVDFEEACIDHLLLDVGMTINGFCFSNNELDVDLLTSFLASYQSFRQLTNEEKMLLLPFIQIAAFGMLCWHMRFSLVDIPHEKQERRVRELIQRIKLIEKNNLSERVIAALEIKQL